MRKVNPDDVRADFAHEANEIIAYFDRVSSALVGRPTEKQDISRLASNSFLALFVAFERFLSDLFLAYLNRDFSQYEMQLKARLNSSIEDKFGKGVLSLVSIKAKPHAKLAELEGIVDPDRRNLTFPTTDELKKSAVKWLAPAHASRITTIATHEARLIDTARAIRNFIAHRSPASRAGMNQLLATVESGNHNRHLGRGANDVNSVGAFLKSAFGGRRRLHFYADGLKSVATHI